MMMPTHGSPVLTTSQHAAEALGLLGGAANGHGQIAGEMVDVATVSAMQAMTQQQMLATPYAALVAGRWGAPVALSGVAGCLPPLSPPPMAHHPSGRSGSSHPSSSASLPPLPLFMNPYTSHLPSSMATHPHSHSHPTTASGYGQQLPNAVGSASFPHSPWLYMPSSDSSPWIDSRFLSNLSPSSHPLLIPNPTAPFLADRTPPISASPHSSTMPRPSSSVSTPSTPTHASIEESLDLHDLQHLLPNSRFDKNPDELHLAHNAATESTHLAASSSSSRRSKRSRTAIATYGNGTFLATGDHSAPSSPDTYFKPTLYNNTARSTKHLSSHPRSSPPPYEDEDEDSVGFTNLGDGPEADRKFRCAVEGCNKSFKRSGHLKRHRLVHLPPTQRERYRCYKSSCNKHYSTKYDLAAHMRQAHDGIELLQCTVSTCNRRFVRKGALEHHLATCDHTREQPSSGEEHSDDIDKLASSPSPTNNTAAESSYQSLLNALDPLPPPPAKRFATTVLNPD